MEGIKPIRENPKKCKKKNKTHQKGKYIVKILNWVYKN